MKARLRQPARWAPLVALVATLALPATGLARDWLPPSDLSSPGGDASFTKVVVDPVGNETAVWKRITPDGEATIQSSFRPATTGIWSAPRNLSSVDSTLSLPAIAADGVGGVTVVWRRFNGDNYVIEGTVRSSQGAWGAVQAISQTGENAYEPDVAMDAAGAATVVWRRLTGPTGFQVVQASRRPAGGTWEPPITLSADGAEALVPHIAVDQSGNAVASWKRSDGSNYVVQVASRPVGGGWTAPVTLSQTGQDALAPVVAMGPSGDAAVVWRRSDGTSVVVQAAVRKGLTGAWQASPDTLSAPGEETRFARVALDAAGAVTAAWTRFDGKNDIVQAISRSTAGVWGAVQNLSEPGRDASAPDLAVEPGGNAVAVWLRFDGSNQIVQSASRGTGAWEELRDLSAPGRSADEARVAVSPNGIAAAIWTRSDGANKIAQATVRTNTGPSMSVSIPAVGKPKTPISFSAQTTPGAFPLTSPPVWSFGDGGTATGYTVTHTYASVGTYTVSVSQSDSAGNPVGAQRQIQISGDPSVTTNVLSIEITGFRAKPAIFATRIQATCVAATASRKRTCHPAKGGTTLSFRASRAARLVVVVRSAKTKRIVAKIPFNARPRLNKVTFTGKVGRRVLPKGTYLVILTPLKKDVSLKSKGRLTIKVKILR